MDKYYTPELEEFHPGFIFELEETEQGTAHKDWHKAVFGNLLINSHGGQYSTDLKDVKQWIENGEVRVKYLDHEDIESLDWASITAFIEDKEPHIEYWRKSSQTLLSVYSGNKIRISGGVNTPRFLFFSWHY